MLMGLLSANLFTRKTPPKLGGYAFVFIRSEVSHQTAQKEMISVKFEHQR